MKTDFSNGTIVTSEFLDKIFFENGGHKHDGGSEDGHCSKIDINNETSGQLLLTRLHGYEQGTINCWVQAGLAGTPSDIPVIVKYIRFLNYVQLYIPRVTINTAEVVFYITFPDYGMGQTLFPTVRSAVHIPCLVINEDAPTESPATPGAVSILDTSTDFLFFVQATDLVSGLSVYNYHGFEKVTTGVPAQVLTFYLD